MDAGRKPTEREESFVDARGRNEYVRICLAALLFSITQNYSALLVIVFQRSGRSIPEIGVLISSFAVPTLAGTLASSAICARLGVLRTIRVAMVLTMIGLCSLAFTRSSFSLALVSRLVQGCGVGLLLPSGLVYVQSRLRPIRFVYYVAIFSAMIPLATSVAPPLGSWTLNRFGATAMFLSAALWTLAALALTLGARPAEAPRRERGLGLRRSMRRRLVAPLFAVLVGGALYGYVISFLPAHLAANHVALAYFFVPSTAAMLASRFGAMRRLQAFHPRALVIGGLALSALGMVCAAVVNGRALAIAAGLGLGAGNSLMFPVIAAWVGRGAPPHERAGGQALASTSFYFGMYATPYVQAFMVKAWGYAGAEIGLAVISCATVLALVAPRASAD